MNPASEPSRQPFRRMAFRRWYAATTLLAMSTSTRLAVLLTLVGVTGSTSLAGLITGAMTAVELLCGVVGGVLGDTVDRRTVLRRCVLLACGVDLALVVIVSLWATAGGGHVVTEAPMNWVLALLLIAGAGTAGMADPVLDGSVKMLVSAEEFPRVIGAAETRASILSVVGGPASGALFAVFPGLPYIVRVLCNGGFLQILRRIPDHLGPDRLKQRSDNPSSGLAFSARRPGPRARVGKALRAVIDGYRESFAHLRSDPAAFRILWCAPLVNLLVLSGTSWAVLRRAE